MRMMGDQKVSALIISITTIDPDKMDTSGTSGKQSATQDNEIVLALFKDLVVAQDMAVPVAAMNALVLKLKDSKANTWMHLEKDLRSAINSLKTCSEDDLGGRSHISLHSGCELFMKYLTRAFSLQFMDFNSCKAELLRRGERFADMSLSARAKIAELGHSFIQDNCTLLVHGVSRVVTGLILKAAESKHFNLIITESRPDAAGLDLARLFSERGIPTKVVLDAAVGAVMEEVDLCLVGAEGVMENGGIVNKIGTYQISLVAKALDVPFYVAVESYKFSRLYPLSQRDVMDLSDYSDPSASSTSAFRNLSLQPPAMFTPSTSVRPSFNQGVPASPSKIKRSFSDLASALPANVTVEQTNFDFTPAKCITLLFTDIGVLTPAAVSDELIRLYQ